MMIYEPYGWIVVMMEEDSAASNAVARSPVLVMVGSAPRSPNLPLQGANPEVRR